MGPSLFFPWLSVNENTRRTIAQKIRAMFVGGVEGAWYDPSDLSTMFQDSAGVTPVTATGQSTGLMLDKRLGLVRGADVVAPLSAWTYDTGWSMVGDTVVATAVQDVGSGGGYAFRAGVLTTGQAYEIFFTVDSISGGGLYFSSIGGAAFIGDSVTSPGTYRAIVTSAPGTQLFFFCNTGTLTAVISGITVREVAGNHAIQTTSGSRPIFRDVGGLRYLEFDGVDDYLRSTFTIAQPIDRISAIQQVTWEDGDRLFGPGTSGEGILYNAVGTPSIYTYAGVGGIGPIEPVLGTNNVITERHDGAATRIALNSGAYTTGDGGTTVPVGITLGASASATQHSNFFLHQLIMRGSTTAMTDAQIAACRALCAAKSGVTL